MLKAYSQYAMTSEKAVDSAELVAKHWLHVGPSEMRRGHRQSEFELHVTSANLSELQGPEQANVGESGCEQEATSLVRAAARLALNGSMHAAQLRTKEPPASTARQA